MNRTPIEWTHWSVNPLKMRMPDGTLINVCVHKSDGCRFCYAEGIVRRWWKKEWGEFPGYTAALLKLGTPVLVEEELQAVLKLSRRITEGKADPEINKIFWSDMTDEYLEFWPDEFIDKCWSIRSITPNLIHQILTKRVDRLLSYFNDPYHMNRARTWVYVYDQQTALHQAAASWPLPNTHIGVSCEDQKTADERIPLLLQTPAAVRWISAEPLLGTIDLARAGLETRMRDLDTPDDINLNWCVVGGESGPNARGLDLSWARSVVSQCQAAGVPVFVKQLGAHPFERRPAGGPQGVRAALANIEKPHPQRTWFRDGWTLISKGEVSEWIKGYRLNDKKGGDPSEWPADLRVREFPSEARA